MVFTSVSIVEKDGQKSKDKNVEKEVDAKINEGKNALSGSGTMSGNATNIAGTSSDIQNEENLLKKEQEKLVAQKSVLTSEEFKEKEDTFKQKVNKIQGKVEKIRRELESTMAKGMQIIQQEAVKHMKEIAKKEGYLLVFDANTTVISADNINISNIVVEKLNNSLPKITVEKKKEKKVD